MFKRVINKMLYPETYSSEAYINYIRKRGGTVGRECHIFNPNTVTIDMTRPYLIEIGNNVVITKNVTILTHDYSHTVMRKRFGIQCGDAAKVEVGNNVFIGMGAMILMGSSIGNNVIIGANAVVKGKIPDDVVVAGNPAKIVCTIEEYYTKHIKNQLKCAVDNVLQYRKVWKRNPTIEEMGDAFAWLYLPHNGETVEKYPQFFDLPGDNKEDIIKHFVKSSPQFDSYEEFLKYIDNNRGNLK